MKIQLKLKDGNAVVLVSGAMNEASDAALSPLLKRIRARHVVFDFRMLTGANSFGIKRWIAFLDELTLSHTCEFVRCPVTLVEYFQILPTRLRVACASSLEIPYQCRGCLEESGVVFSVEDLRRKAPGTLRCLECGSAKEPAVSVASYLSFLDPESP